MRVLILAVSFIYFCKLTNCWAIGIFFEFPSFYYTKHKKNFLYPEVNFKKEYIYSKARLNIDISAKGIFSEYKFKDEKVEINKLSFDFYLSDEIECKIGQDKLSWGKLLYLSFWDITNPFIVRRLFLEGERQKAKLSQLLFYLSLIKEDLGFNFLIIPSPRQGQYDDLNEASFYEPRFILPIYVIKPKKPIEYGIKLLKTLEYADFGIYYFKNITDFPIYKIDPLKMLLEANYPREDRIGIDFETVYKKFCIKGEIIYIPKKVFQKKNFLGEVYGKFFEFGMGLDRKLNDWILVAECMYTKAFVKEALEEQPQEITTALSVEKRWNYDKKKFNILFINNWEAKSYLVRLKQDLKIIEQIWLSLGFVLFGSKNANDILCRYKDNDYIFINLKVYL